MSEFEKFEVPTEPNYYNYKVSIGNAILLFIVTFIVGQVLSSLVIAPTFIYPELNPVLLPLSFLLGFGASAIILTLLKGMKIKELKNFFHIKVSILHIGLAILLYFVSLPIAEYLSMVVPTDGNSFLEKLYETFISSFEMIFKYKIAAFIMVCILAPILEELIFRGLILRGMLNNRINPWYAVVFTAIIFGLAHMNPWQFFGAGFIGIVLGFVYWRTQSLILCMFLHFLNNVIGYVITMQTESLEETIFEPNYALLTGACVLTIIVGYYFHKVSNETALDGVE